MWLKPACMTAAMAAAFMVTPTHAELSAEELAKLAQNPVGGVGKIFHFGKVPVNTQISAYYNVVRPDFGANWQIRAQVQLMFPK
jgi:hypothetical protein